MTQLASFGNANPDITAVCQQAALISCLYQNDRVRAEQLLGTDGTILVWTFRDSTWPPSHAVIRSGPDRYFIIFTGTTNVPQAAIHVGGTFWRSYVTDVVLVNGQWQAVLEAVYEEIRPQLPDDLADATLHVSGHSYGGSLGHLVANKLVSESSQQQVQLITFGEAKALSPRYVGPQAFIHWRIASNQDVVQYLPPDGEVFGTYLWENPVTWLLNPVDWAHYGRYRPLNWDGAYVPSQPVYPLPPGVTEGPVTEHLLRNYWGRLSQRLINVESTAAAVVALAIMDATLSGQPAQPVTPELPRAVKGPTGVAEIPVPGYDGPPFVPFVGVPPMPDPVYLDVTGNRLMHATQMFNADRQGWSESFYLFVSGANDSPHALSHQWLAELNEARRTVMPDDYQIEGQRVSDVDNERDGDPVAAPNYSLGKGRKTSAAAPPERGWNVIMRDSSKKVGVTRIFRGWTVTNVPYLVQGGAVVTAKPQDVINWFGAMKAHMLTTFTVQNLAGNVVPAIRTYDRRLANSPVRQITLFGVNENGNLTVKTSETATTFGIGNRVKVTAGRKKCIRGLSGPAKVIAATVDAGNAKYTLDKKPCCVGASLVGILGTIRLDATGYVRIQDMTLGYTAKRDVGRAFFVTAGAHKGKCC